ncbi:MAG: hypothetical protein O3A00_05285 [Planctomycetota bacterium]|nr:hypothetical protein [Planctomycetota bacterium]
MTPKTRLLTDRDYEIVSALTQKVRLFSLRQLAGAWWDGELANTRRRLNVLVSVRLVQRVSVRARTLPPLTAPVVAWQPPESPPNFGQVAHQLQDRWVRRAVRTATAFIATERAARLIGGTARASLKQPAQATHDLGLSQVWLHFRSDCPARADAWRSEDLLAHTRHGQKLPDAFLVDAEENTVAVIEFGGSYDGRRVRDFHNDCVIRNLPYQIW